MSTAAQIAAAHWGALPRWVSILADACDRAGRQTTAARIGYSPGVISEVLRNKYPGRADALERAVLTAFGAGLDVPVDCPVIGRIAAGDCREHRELAGRGVKSSPLRVQFLRACPDCPNNPRKRMEAADAAQ